MSKVVINCKYGGFDLSNEACDWLANHGVEVDHSGWIIDEGCKEKPVYAMPILGEYKGLLGNPSKPISRHDPLLVQCVEELGEKASGRFAKLKVITIPGNLYRIEEYDGYEHIETPDDIEWIIIT